MKEAQCHLKWRYESTAGDRTLPEESAWVLHTLQETQQGEETQGILAEGDGHKSPYDMS